MTNVDHPLLLSLFLFIALWLSMFAGDRWKRRLRQLQPDERQDFNIILTATLTLLSLILGFSFSMAITRYDQRKGYEEAEANAISAEYSRAELLPASKLPTCRDYYESILPSASRSMSPEIAVNFAGSTAKLTGCRRIMVGGEGCSSDADNGGRDPG